MDAHQHVQLRVDSDARVGIKNFQINALKFAEMGSITAKISVMMAIMLMETAVLIHAPLK